MELSKLSDEDILRQADEEAGMSVSVRSPRLFAQAKQAAARKKALAETPSKTSVAHRDMPRRKVA